MQPTGRLCRNMKIEPAASMIRGWRPVSRPRDMLTFQVIPTLFQQFGQIIHPRVELHMSIGLWCVLPNKGSEPLSVLQRGIEFNNPSSDFIQDFPVKLVFI